MNFVQQQAARISYDRATEALSKITKEELIMLHSWPDLPPKTMHLVANLLCSLLWAPEERTWK